MSINKDKREMEKDSEREKPITEGEKYCEMFDEMSPKDPHAKLKEKYAIGKYDCYGSNLTTNSGYFTIIKPTFKSSITWYMLIKKEHSLIAEAVIANPDVEVECKYEKSKHFPNEWIDVETKDFFEQYTEDYEYRLAKPQNEIKVSSMEDLDNLPTIGEDTHPLLNPESKHYSMVDDIEAIERMEQMYTTGDLMIWAKCTAMKYRLRIGNKDDVQKEAKKIETYEAYYTYLKGKK